MARAGETPTPEFEQGDELPYGQASQANSLVGLIAPPPDSGQDYKPQGDAESFALSPTDRPNEPVTAGMPFGLGPGVVNDPQDNDQQLVQRVALQATADPRAPAVLKQFAKRVAEGQ